jgi:hypothetical protein
MISGASGADTKKFGISPNRLATSRSKLEFLDGDGIFDSVGIFVPSGGFRLRSLVASLNGTSAPLFEFRNARVALYSSSAAIARDRPL